MDQRWILISLLYFIVFFGRAQVFCRIKFDFVLRHNRATNLCVCVCVCVWKLESYPILRIEPVSVVKDHVTITFSLLTISQFVTKNGRRMGKRYFWPKIKFKKSFILNGKIPSLNPGLVLRSFVRSFPLLFVESFVNCLSVFQTLPSPKLPHSLTDTESAIPDARLIIVRRVI